MRELVERLQVLGHLGPALGVDEVAADPGAVDVVGQVVLHHVRPADRVDLGRAAPPDAVELAGLHGDLDVLPGQRHRHHAELGQEAAGGREGEDALALQVGEALDRHRGAEVAGVPGAGAEPGDAGVGVGLLPDLLQPVVGEERRHVEAEERGEGEVGAEDRDVGRRAHRVVVGLRGVERALLHGAEELALRHQLVGEVELDLHLAVRRLVEGLDRGLDHEGAERRAGVGLQPPLDRRLRLDVGRGQRRGADRPGAGEAGPLQECASVGHGRSPCCSSQRRSKFCGSQSAICGKAMISPRQRIISSVKGTIER